MARAIEGHVLKKMGQATLLWLFKDRAHTLRYVEVGLSRCLSIMTYIIGKPIAERAFAHTAVEGQGLCHGGHEAAEAEKKR